MPTRVFLDSNIWISAFYHSKNCEALIRTQKGKNILIIICAQVLEESTRNIREKIPHQLDNFHAFLLTNPPEIVADPETIPPDIAAAVSPEDRPIFTAARLANVDYFVTGNVKHFKRNARNKLGKITILTPKEAVKLLKMEDS